MLELTLNMHYPSTRSLFLCSTLISVKLVFSFSFSTPHVSLERPLYFVMQSCKCSHVQLTPVCSLALLQLSFCLLCLAMLRNLSKSIKQSWAIVIHHYLGSTQMFKTLLFIPVISLQSPQKQSWPIVICPPIYEFVKISVDQTKQVKCLAQRSLNCQLSSSG